MNAYGGSVVNNPPAYIEDLRDLGSILESIKILWRREWLPTPVLLPGEPHRQRSLARYSP